MLKTPVFGKDFKSLTSNINWGPPSDTTSVGFPKRENASFRGAVVIYFRSRTSVNKEKELVIMRYSCPLRMQRSRSSLSQGLVGNGGCWSGSLQFAGRSNKHWWQRLTMFSMSRSIPGQKTESRALRRVLSMP